MNLPAAEKRFTEYEDDEQEFRSPAGRPYVLLHDIVTQSAHIPNIYQVSRLRMKEFLVLHAKRTSIEPRRDVNSDEIYPGR